MLSLVMEQSRQLSGIAKLKDAYLDNDPVCLVYEYVNGGDLCGLMAKLERCEPKHRIESSTQIVKGLATTVGHFHTLPTPIVHRDLKPANILVEWLDGNKFKLHIADFGIGGLAVNREEVMTSQGVSRGGLLTGGLRGSHTPLYASPQQIKSQPPDPRDDVHALGVIWYQLLTCDIQQAPGIDYSDDLHEMDVPGPLIQLIGQCIASKAERRPKDGKDLVEKLTEAVQLAGLRSKSPPPTEPPAKETLKEKAAPSPRPSSDTFIQLKGTSPSAKRALRYLDLTNHGQEIELYIHNPKGSAGTNRRVSINAIQLAVDQATNSGVRSESDVTFAFPNGGEVEVQITNGWWIWVSRQELKSALAKFGISAGW